MRSIRYWVAAALTAVATMALAKSPYEISGLHTELTFSEAVAQAQKLGGSCQITRDESQQSGTSAQCEYVPCSLRNPTGGCAQQDTAATGLTIAAQPIVRIGLDAPGESAHLTRIVFVYEGSRDTVAEYLTLTFGPPSGEVARADEKSWSHSQRLAWTQGIYRVGLLDSPKLIILGADRSQE